MVLESDLAEAIDVILGGGGGPKDDKMAIDECKELLTRNWIMEMRHIGREANEVADMIAKWAARQEFGVFEVAQPLDFLQTILKEEEQIGEII